ncbi:ABC transporter ATP-binding protein [Paenibacillus alvei]|uniref:ABC transporter ATP-binding protein n=1 Tax=Paenibacillus alvei TaxID=44250 RepID=UPI0022816E5A|nr:ABC transporter ATP-binding protein [Paenibacillus alvei]
MTITYDVELQGVHKRFGGTVVVDNFNLGVERGECVTFLGPSGCGKTTTLNMIAGFLEPDGGELRIKGKSMRGVPANKRDLGMVFQTYSLFPHMTVGENVAYGLKLRKTSKSEMADRVKKVLDLVKLPHVIDRYPKQLSGGQRQRIAIARALVTEPSLLLLDEPLSNLDAKLREELREEMKRLQQEIGVTTIFVTHDQEEAMYLSDRIVVLDHGAVEQIGTPEQIYHEPASAFVHEFIGKSNRFEATVVAVNDHWGELRTAGGIRLKAERNGYSFKEGEQVLAYVRPEHIRMEAVRSEAGDSSNESNCSHGAVSLVSFLGSYGEMVVRTADGLISVRTHSQRRHQHVSDEQLVKLTWDEQDVIVFPRKEG